MKTIERQGMSTCKRQTAAIPLQLRKRLEKKLLDIGGSRVLWQAQDPHATLIAARGRLFSQRVRMRRGDPHQCHANAADFWATGRDSYELVTGYALSRDNWVSHSWVIDGKALYETTGRFDKYYGVVLLPFIAMKFWWENVYDQRFGNKEPPREFCQQRPRIGRLMKQLHEMPQDERTRVLTAQSLGLQMAGSIGAGQDSLSKKQSVARKQEEHHS